MPDIAYAALLPEICLSVLALALLLLNFSVPEGNKGSIAGVAVAALVVAGVCMVPLWNHPVTTFAGSYAVDNFALFFKTVFLLAAGLAILHSGAYLRQEGSEHGEYYALLLFAVVGMMVMASGRDLMVIYVGLELMSITFYALVGLIRARLSSNEASLKYFLLGAFSSDFRLDVIGSREQGLKQIFSSASEHSSLIIEYVQRFGDFQGFFTRENVAELTHAAGVEEELLELQAGSHVRRDRAS